MMLLATHMQTKIVNTAHADLMLIDIGKAEINRSVCTLEGANPVS